MKLVLLGPRIMCLIHRKMNCYPKSSGWDHQKRGEGVEKKERIEIDEKRWGRCDPLAVETASKPWRENSTLLLSCAASGNVLPITVRRHIGCRGWLGRRQHGSALIMTPTLTTAESLGHRRTINAPRLALLDVLFLVSSNSILLSVDGDVRLRLQLILE
jgi:hypothetical protein